jgi:tRNA-Thr(GGU) m(6)t(6)A37 methyltransferase TsaA
MTYDFPVIGTLESCFRGKNGTPRQPGVASSARSRLRLKTTSLNNPAYSLDELEGFSHVWVLFVFHLDEGAKSCANGEVDERKPLKSKVTPPRLKGKKVGLFATRSPHRPAPIGLSLVKLEKVVGDELYLCGGDMVNGTPVLDIKPYLPVFDTPGEQGEPRARVKVPQWASPESVLVGDLTVCFTARAKRQLEQIFKAGRPRDALTHNEPEMIRLVGQILSGDPRSVYRRDKCSDRLYFIELDGLHITAWFDEAREGQVIAEVLRVRLDEQIVVAKASAEEAR